MLDTELIQKWKCEIIVQSGRDVLIDRIKVTESVVMIVISFMMIMMVAILIWLMLIDYSNTDADNVAVLRILIYFYFR